ncbi:unnamed protein product [Caenorhabditis sp. 36 PRJEB53466]|nr:unnamed protein product [Caenorhabditis sp. 36 PRJEB53466]
MSLSRHASAAELQKRANMLNRIKTAYMKWYKIQPPVDDPTFTTFDTVVDTFYKYANKLRDAKATYAAEPLEPRARSESEISLIIPVGTDFRARQRFIGNDGRLRIGRLLEVVDLVAPCCLYKLNRADMTSTSFEDGTLPRMFVTSRFHPTNLSWNGDYQLQDLLMTAKVTWTSEFRAETTVAVQARHGEMFSARLVFTSLDGRDTSKKLPMNQLKPKTPWERVHHKQRDEVNTARPPLPDVESIEIPIIKEGQVSVSSTRALCELVAQPEHENPYGSVFGGFLIRKGLETAELCARKFAGDDVKIVSLMEAEFIRVVELGGILSFESYVCNVNNNTKQIQVVTIANVYNPETKKFEMCDRFCFNFEFNKNSALPEVVPQTVQEFISQWKVKQMRQKDKDSRREVFVSGSATVIK